MSWRSCSRPSLNRDRSRSPWSPRSVTSSAHGVARTLRSGSYAISGLVACNWPLTDTDVARMADLAERCADLRLGGTDASVIAIAERLGIHRIATFDRRPFTVVRTAHVEAFTLLQEATSS